MSLAILWEKDIDGAPLAGLRVGILGYGNQGRAHAQNLRDAGVDVRVGLRPKSASLSRTAADGLLTSTPAEVARWADVLMVLVPDEEQPALLAAIAGDLAAGRGRAIGFAHGFNVTYERLALPPAAGVFLVAPCAPGERLRAAYVRGGGVFAYVAVAQDPDGRTRDLALAYARALGCARAGVLVTTFRLETEVDLFGEQAVLCGGLHALLTAAYDALVAAGYPPEMAYLECHDQLVWLAATVQAEGITGTRRRISSTALYGDLTRGERVIGEEAREGMRAMLDEIRSGEFARELGAEIAAGRPRIRAELARRDALPMEEIGRKLRAWRAAGRRPEEEGGGKGLAAGPPAPKPGA
jgi:ketol-acid reductoisomerase